MGWSVRCAFADEVKAQPNETAHESSQAAPDGASLEAMAKYLGNYWGADENCYPGHGSSSGDNYMGRIGAVSCADWCDDWRRRYGRCDGFVMSPLTTSAGSGSTSMAGASATV